LKPDVVVGSYPCAYLSARVRLPRVRMEPAGFERILAQARVRPAFCTDVYMGQFRRGQQLLHEHPAGAVRWVEGALVM